MNVKVITTKLLLMTVSLAVTLSACKKDSGPEITSPAESTKKNWDETVKAVAKDVSKKLNSVHFRKMLKHEVTIRFDGEANILLSSITQRLPKYLAYEASRNASARNADDELLLSSYSRDIIAEAGEEFPQMQIAVQTDAESWDPSMYIPDVVYVTSQLDEATSELIHGYDRDQNPISVDAQNDPTVNYVVISQNERTTIRDEEVRLTVSNCLLSDLIYRVPYNPEANAARMPIDCGGGDTGGGGTGGGGTGHPQYVGVGQNGRLPTLIGSQAGTIVPSPTNGTFNRLAQVGTFNGTPVYRKNYRHETMREIRCDRLKDIESWFNGAPEIRLHVFEQNVLNPSENMQIYKEQFEPNKRKDIDGEWWDCDDVTMHLWDYAISGTRASFGYYEYDPALIPNETLVAIGQIVVDLLFLSSVDSTTTPNQMTIYGNIRQSVATGIRSLKKANGVSEYIGKDDYSIFNDKDEPWEHNTGRTKFKTWPDL